MSTSARRLWWLLRVAAHDWMWEGGSAAETDRLRRAARRLPLYFTDPYLDGIPRDPDKFYAWFDSLEHVEVVGPRPVVPIVSTWPLSTAPRTWSTSTVTPTWTYPNNWPAVEDD